MKILKILLILLIPAMGVVGCRKSECKPQSSPSSKPANVPSTNTPVNGRVGEISGDQEDPQGGNVVGSGDDDRDGGDKKSKKLGH